MVNLFMIIFLNFCRTTLISHGAGADTISANQSLSGNLTIISSGGNFQLGFFTPGKSSKYYIGIWYKKVSIQSIVWVANRETPISDKNHAQLKILDGNLVVLNESHNKIWSTDLDSTASTSPVFAVLLDNGNLVLREGSSSLGQSLWESFDNPTDTFLPWARLGYDKKTQKKQILTSWKSDEDPANGLYSFELDPERKEFVLRWNKSDQYWTSGPWNGHSFRKAPGLNYMFNFSIVDNENTSYFTYSIYYPSILSRLVLGVSGHIQQMSWEKTQWLIFGKQPEGCNEDCGAFSICNANLLPWPQFCSCLPGFKIRSPNDWMSKNYSGGCTRESNLQCGNTSDQRRDIFAGHPAVYSPISEQLQKMARGSIGECESACLRSCSCTAYAFRQNICMLWSGEIMNLQQLKDGDRDGETIYIRLSGSSSGSSSTQSATKNNKQTLIYAVVGSIAGVLVLLAIVLAVICSHQRKKSISSKAVEGFLVPFKYKDLQNTTKNFSDKLGRGGFGSVFRGTLPDSTIIAVKKLESVSQGEKQFRSEVSTVGIIQHVNLVRLRGFCAEGNKKMLVYDYMENGSLDSHLFDTDEGKVLDWKTRYKIASGTARGLAYLHENCKDCIIHCDVKPENILLDAELCPKVADFGLAKLVDRDFSRVLTTIRGTIGYLAPEWISGVEITAKADVYSYGMMLFELVSGRRNTSHFEDENVGYFPFLAATVTIEGGDVLSLLDPKLCWDADSEEVLKLCKVACWCVQANENIRPSMSQVVQILEGVMDVDLPPFPQWFQVLVESQDRSVFNCS